MAALENRVIYTDFNINRATAYKLPYADIGGKEVHVEPVVRFGGADSRLHGLAGLRYFHAKQDEFVNIFGGATFKDKTDTNSAFAELTYALTPQVDVTAASRLEREHRKRNGGSRGAHRLRRNLHRVPAEVGRGTETDGHSNLRRQDRPRL